MIGTNWNSCRNWRSHAAGARPLSAQEMSLVRSGGKTAGKFGRVQQFLQIDSRVVAHALQKIDKIFRCEVSAGSRAIRTTAQAGRGGIKFANARFKSRECVGQ